MDKREIIQKTANRVNQKLRDSAKACPHCMRCGLGNPNCDLLCLAHSNRLGDGKGRGLKATDESGAILCAACHAYVDYAGPSRAAMQREHFAAHERTMAWWRARGYL